LKIKGLQEDNQLVSLFLVYDISCYEPKLKCAPLAIGNYETFFWLVVEGMVINRENFFLLPIEMPILGWINAFVELFLAICWLAE
jgi:hypothetical protein